MRIAPLTSDDLPQWAELLAVSFDRKPCDMDQLIRYFDPVNCLVAWGAWDGDRLVAQYSCLLRDIVILGVADPVRVGMSVNMAVHPDYRGRGLVKQVAAPVYDEVIRRGAWAGVGFSNADGVRVDKRSKGYGYQVVGRMSPTVCVLGSAKRYRDYPPLTLTDHFPDDLQFPMPRDDGLIRFLSTSKIVRWRFGEHPLQTYHYGVWRDGDRFRGLIVYRQTGWGAATSLSLLAAYGDDLSSLLLRLAATLKTKNICLIHSVTTPQSSMLAALSDIGICIKPVFTRSPYYLTLKPLKQDIPPELLDFNRWDCMGGDIL